jgi:hypothetical protein
MENATTISTTIQTSTITDRFLGAGQHIYIFLSLKQTYLSLLAIGIVIGFFLLVRNYKRKQKGLLTTKLKVRIREMRREKDESYFTRFINQIYYPSWSSVAAVTIPLAIFTYISKVSSIHIWFTHWIINVPGGVLDFTTSSHYQNLIAIHGGVGAVIFALLIFVAESLRDDETKDRARVLLRESFLFPLTVLEILSFLIFIWGNVNAWSVVPVIAVAILTIISLWRLIEVLLNKSKFAEKRLKVLKDRINRSITSAINERVGDNIFLKPFNEGKINFKYYPFSLDGDEKPGRTSINAEKTGLIVDIRIDKLLEASALLEAEANKNGYSFSKDKPKPKEAKAESGQSELVETKYYNQIDGHYIHKKYRDSLDEEDRLLASIDTTVIKDKTVIPKLTKLIRDAFIIKPGEGFSEEMKLEIAGLEGQFIDAIKNDRSDKVIELTKTYINLAESFLEAISCYGGGYSYEDAKKERGEIFGGWNEVQWITDSIRDIFEKATRSDDRKIVLNVAYLPIAIAIRAIKYRDQYLFQEFIRFPVQLYYLATKETRDDIKDLIIDRSWRYLKEISDYYIENQLTRKVTDVMSVKQYADFTTPIFQAFQDLLKASFDKRDFSSFSIFLATFVKLYNRDIAYNHHSAEHLEQSLLWVTDPNEQEAIRKRVEVEKEREKAIKDIRLKKKQIIFGLSSLFFEKWRKNLADESVKQFYVEASKHLPSNLPELTSLYQSSRTHEVERVWNWDSWESIPDGEVHIIDVHTKQDHLYCIKALKILAPMDSAAASGITLPTSRDFAFLVEDRTDGNTIIPFLKEIKSHPENWTGILDANAIAKVDIFLELLKTAKENQENNEGLYLQTVEINPSKLQEFREKIREGFYSTVRLRGLAQKLRIYKDRLNEEPGKSVPSFGYNQLDNKAAFIESWHVHYGGWGENYGDGMANSEDQLIFQQITKAIKTQKLVKKENIIDQIEKAITEQKMVNPIIIQTLEYLFEYDSIKRSDLFIEKYRRDCPKTPYSDLKAFLGVMTVAGKNIPVIDIFVRDEKLKNKIVIADFEKLGTFNQYAPIDKPEDVEYKFDIFYLRVDDLNIDTDQRNKLIEQNPAWLQKHADKEAYLKQQVVIRLYQKFRFEVKDSSAGVVLTVNKPRA